MAGATMLQNSRIGASEDFAALAEIGYQQETLGARAAAATIFRASGQDQFLPEDFAQQVKREEIRVPGPVNYTNNFTYAATTTYTDNAAAWTYTNPSDRYTIVWSMGLEMHNLLASAAGTMPADGPLRQLRSNMSIICNFPNGKAIQRSYAEFDLGVAEIEQDGQTTLVGIAMSQQLLKERLKRMVVQGQPLGVLMPNDILTVGIANGGSSATPADSVSGVQITQYLLCQEYCTS
jgi:hypothetical protein